MIERCQWLISWHASKTIDDYSRRAYKDDSGGGCDANRQLRPRGQAQSLSTASPLPASFLAPQHHSCMRSDRRSHLAPAQPSGDEQTAAEALSEYDMTVRSTR